MKFCSSGGLYQGLCACFLPEEVRMGRTERMSDVIASSKNKLLCEQVWVLQLVLLR